MLKRTFITALILAHWDLEAPIMVEMDASDHVLATILSIHVGEDIHPVTFYSRMFNPVELNYDVHDKELLMIYEAFRKWCHYLKGTPRPVDVVTDHRNLVYSSGSKLLTRWQVCWSKYLAQFNLLIWFRLGCLGTKPNTLTWRPNLYPARENQPPGLANLFNHCPLFT